LSRRRGVARGGGPSGGTIRFMSPRGIRGSRRQQEHACDQYDSLSCHTSHLRHHTTLPPSRHSRFLLFGGKVLDYLTESFDASRIVHFLPENHGGRRHADDLAVEHL